MARTIGLTFNTKIEVTEDNLELQELKDYAKENGIDIGKSNTVAGIRKKIAEAEVTQEDPTKEIE